MKKVLKIAALSIVLLSSLAKAENIVCNVGNGKMNSEPVVITAPLNKSSGSSIDQTIGDFRILAMWMPDANLLAIGVIELTTTMSASTLLKNGSGSLFVSKLGQTVDLNCTLN